MYGNEHDHLKDLSGFKTYELPYFEIDFMHRKHKNEFTVANVNNHAKYDILSMNGKPNKYIRLRHVVMLWKKGLHNNSKINMFRTEQDKQLFDTNDYYSFVEDLLTPAEWKLFCDWWPESHDRHTITNKSLYGKHHSGYPFDSKLFFNTKLSVVAETHAGSNCCNKQFFLSEKLIKSIGNQHPFIVLSTRGYCRELHMRGYKTFSPWIDETYDGIEDAEERMVAAINSAEDYIKNFDPKQRTKVSRSVIHNVNNLRKRYDASVKYIKSIINDI